MIKLPNPSLESFFRTFSIFDFDVSPDEKQIVFSTNINGYYNLWAVDLNKGYPYPLTTKNELSSFIRYLPDQSGILTSFDDDGDENWQIYAVSCQGGELSLVVGESGEKFYCGDISKDSQSLFYYTSVDNPRYHNIWKLDLTTGERTKLIEGSDGPVSFGEVSPDGSSYVYIQSLGNTKDFAYVVDSTGTHCLTPDPNRAHRVTEVKYWDAETILMLTNYNTEFSYLARYNLSTKSFQQLKEIKGFECTEIDIDTENKKVYIVAERGVQDKLFVYHMETGMLDELPLPCTAVRKIQVGKSGNIYVLGLSPTAPANIFASRNGYIWKQLTDHRVLGVGQEDLSEPEVLTYESFDGLQIEALYYAPKADVDNGHTILYPHGGPQAAVRKMFQPLFQYLCYLGFRVFAPNFRGSSGYGETFMNMVNKDWGGGPRKDIIAGMDFLNKQGRAVEGQWFCIGGSYGGYMTLLLHGRHAERFKAFVDQFGPSDLFTTIKTAPEHWKEADRELIGDPKEDKEKLVEDSPITYLSSMTKPMLVVQGVNDPRVVKVESDVIVESLRKRGQDVEYLVLDDEGHGYSKTDNAIKVYKTMIGFINRYI